MSTYQGRPGEAHRPLTVVTSGVRNQKGEGRKDRDFHASLCMLLCCLKLLFENKLLESQERENMMGPSPEEHSKAKPKEHGVQASVISLRKGSIIAFRHISPSLFSTSELL